MIRLISRQMIDVFTEGAEKYLDSNTLEEQRAVRWWHVQELLEKMKSGLFRYGNVAFCRIKNGPWVMLDGQHVCYAICEYMNSVQCVVEKWAVDTLLERSELFRQYEILSRGQPEMVRVEAGALEIKWPEWITNLVVSASAIDIRKKATDTIIHTTNIPGLNVRDANMTRPSAVTKEQKVSALRQYISEGQFICNILTNGNPSEATRKSVRHLVRAAIAYAMMETWRKNHAMAGKFWTEVRDGAFLENDSPTKLLREYLITCSGNKSSGFTKPNNHQYIYRIAVAWNAFIEGRKTALRYRPELQPPPLKAFSEKTKSIDLAVNA